MAVARRSPFSWTHPPSQLPVWALISLLLSCTRGCLCTRPLVQPACSAPPLAVCDFFFQGYRAAVPTFPLMDKFVTPQIMTTRGQPAGQVDAIQSAVTVATSCQNPALCQMFSMVTAKGGGGGNPFARGPTNRITIKVPPGLAVKVLNGACVAMTLDQIVIKTGSGRDNDVVLTPKLNTTSFPLVQRCIMFRVAAP